MATKKENIDDPRSCWNKAKDGTIVFVTLEWDKAAPDTIRYWVRMRIALGLNTHGDPQMTEALLVADEMEARQK